MLRLTDPTLVSASLPARLTVRVRTQEKEEQVTPIQRVDKFYVFQPHRVRHFSVPRRQCIPIPRLWGRVQTSAFVLSCHSALGYSYDDIIDPKLRKLLGKTMLTRTWIDHQVSGTVDPRRLNVDRKQWSWLVTDLDRRHWLWILVHLSGLPVLAMAEGATFPAGKVEAARGGLEGTVAVRVKWDAFTRHTRLEWARLVLSVVDGSSGPSLQPKHLLVGAVDPLAAGPLQGLSPCCLPLPPVPPNLLPREKKRKRM